MDSGKLENGSLDDGNIDYLDFRQLREVADRIEGTTKRQAVRRFALAVLVTWAIASTTYSVMAYYTIEEIVTTVRQIEKTVSENNAYVRANNEAMK